MVKTKFLDLVEKGYKETCDTETEEIGGGSQDRLEGEDVSGESNKIHHI